MYNCQRIISELEDYHDLVESREYADNILRKHFVKSVPDGYTKTDIEILKEDEQKKEQLHERKCSRKKKIDRAVDDGMSGAVWM